VAALIVVGLYVLFVVWRYRVDKRKKAMQNQEASALTQAIAKTAQQMSSPRPADPAPIARPVVGTPLASTPVAATPPPDPPAANADTTVASALQGIALPNGLVPLTTMAPRPNTLDRVAFWTDTAPAEVVGTAFGDELERLGYAVTPLDQQSLAAQRDGVRLIVVVHPDGHAANVGGMQLFASVPERAVVIEVWVPE